MDVKYVIDIDGTLCSNTAPDKDCTHAIPFPDRINRINQLYDEGHTIIIYTSRGYITGIDWRELTEKQLKEWGVKYHELHFGKVYGDFYVDDHNLLIEDFFG